MRTTSSRGLYIFLCFKDVWSDMISTLSWEHDHVYSERQIDIFWY